VNHCVNHCEITLLPAGWLQTQRLASPQSALRPGFKAQTNAHVSLMCAIVSVYGWCATLPWATAGV